MTATSEETAIEQVVGFVQQFDEAHLHLACHAAFPLALTPDLLYQIWARFVDYAPWTAVAHVLLSHLCHEVGHELYEMDTSVRNLLLRELKELADFLKGYVIQQLEGDNPNERDLAQAQYWTALAYENPGKAARELAEALKSKLQEPNNTDAFRLASLIETFPKILSELGFSPLLVTYASGIKSFARGDQKGAVEAFLKLSIQDRQIEIAGVSLRIPDQVQLPPVEPSFLDRVLQVISESNGTPQLVYPFLQENLGKLNDELISLLNRWAVNASSETEPAQVQNKAELIVSFSNLIRDFPLGNRAINLEIAIAGYESTLAIMTPIEFPEQSALLQSNLATAYRERIRGERAENVERAITCSQTALQVYTRKASPESWARSQNSLALAYLERIQGNRAENIEQAIACSQAALQVYTRKAFPESWARSQNSLALAYLNRIRGGWAENIERAIACSQAALQVYTRKAFPESWARSQNSLALAYLNRIRGGWAENIERAIACSQAALQVYTRKAFPESWARSQNSLALAYLNRIRGGWAENIERAIACSQAALQVYTRKAFPESWARSQNSLALAYLNRIRGGWAENIERAIDCLQAALLVYTRENFPESWAKTQNNLGVAYRERMSGNRRENLEAAI